MKYMIFFPRRRQLIVGNSKISLSDTFSNKDTNRTGSVYRPCSSFINTWSETESPVSLAGAFHLILFHSDWKPFSGSDIN